MKKTLLQRSAVIAACAAAFVLGSCSQPEEARVDTVYSLDKPEVTAKAYPGMNVISWKPVTGANGYDVSVYEEGVYKKDIAIYGDQKSVIDYELVNDKNYTYYVEVKSSSSPSGNRAVVAKNNRGEASVKAIVPPFSTKPLELPAYEKDHKDNDEWVLNSSNIKVSVADKKVVVEFPMKAYLKYKIKQYNLSLPHDKNVNDGYTQKNWVYAYTDDYGNDVYRENGDKEVFGTNNNVTGKVSFDIREAGEYEIAIVAQAMNWEYADSEEVVCDTHVIIEDLKLSPETDDVYAEYILTDYAFVGDGKKTARVWFTPAKLDGEYVPTNWYTVYRRIYGEYENTPLAVAVKKSTDTDNGTKYYVDDEGLDVTKDYVYTVVVTDGKKYGKAKTASLDSESMDNLASYIDISDVDSTDNKVSWTVSAYSKAADATIAAKYLVVQDNRSEVPVLAQEIIEKGTDLTLTAVAQNGVVGYKSYTAETPAPSIAGNTAKVYVLVTATKKGYETTNKINFVKLFKLP